MSYITFPAFLLLVLGDMIAIAFTAILAVVFFKYFPKGFIMPSPGLTALTQSVSNLEAAAPPVIAAATSGASDAELAPVQARIDAVTAGLNAAVAPTAATN